MSIKRVCLTILLATVAAGRESPEVAAGVVVAGGVSVLVLSFFANAGTATAAVTSRIAVIFESVIGFFSHARVARDRPLRRTGPESQLMYTGPYRASNAPSDPAL